MQHEEIYRRLKGQIVIDIHDLDGEFVRLPSLLMEAIDHKIMADEITKERKHTLEVRESFESARMRDETNNGKAPSEALIKSSLPLLPEIVEAETELREAETESAGWQGLIDVITAKKESMKKLTELTIAGYVVPNSHRVPGQSDREAMNAKRRKIVE